MNIEELTLQEKIGQMIIVGIEGKTITERTKRLIQEYKVGGVILYRKNFSTYQEMINLISELKKLNQSNKIPLFISIDQEGGRVNRMPKDILNSPSANKLVSSEDTQLIKASACITGKILHRIGFNMNFAPVLDIKRFEDSQAIGDRCYGKNKDEVIKYGIPVMQELKKQKVLPVIKHFPGHGATKTDSHFMLPVISMKYKDLEKEDMEVFNEAIKNGADAILVGHLLVKNKTGLYPASLSRSFIINNLRKKYHYRGLIVSDDLKMRAIKLLYGSISAVKKAFMARNDIVIFRFSEKEEKKAINEVINMVKNEKLKMGYINNSVRRIIKTKELYEINDNNMPQGIDIEEVNEKIKEIRERVLI